MAAIPPDERYVSRPNRVDTDVRIPYTLHKQNFAAVLFGNQELVARSDIPGYKVLDLFNHAEDAVRAVEAEGLDGVVVPVHVPVVIPITQDQTQQDLLEQHTRNVEVDQAQFKAEKDRMDRRRLYAKQHTSKTLQEMVSDQYQQRYTPFTEEGEEADEEEQVDVAPKMPDVEVKGCLNKDIIQPIQVAAVVVSIANASSQTPSVTVHAKFTDAHQAKIYILNTLSEENDDGLVTLSEVDTWSFPKWDLIHTDSGDRTYMDAGYDRFIQGHVATRGTIAHVKSKLDDADHIDISRVGGASLTPLDPEASLHGTEQEFDTAEFNASLVRHAIRKGPSAAAMTPSAGAAEDVGGPDLEEDVGGLGSLLRTMNEPEKEEGSEALKGEEEDDPLCVGHGDQVRAALLGGGDADAAPPPPPAPPILSTPPEQVTHAVAQSPPVRRSTRSRTSRRAESS